MKESDVDDGKDPHFDQYADTYRDMHTKSIRASGEEPEYFADYKIAYLRRKVADVQSVTSMDILDFGCGVGGSLTHLRRYFPRARLNGVDVSGESLKVAQSKGVGATLAQIVDGSIPLPDASVDLAMAACVYHHIPPAERLHWTREIKRVLRPGGMLFVFEHNILNPLTRKVVRECEFDDDAILLPRRESLGLLGDAGFSKASCDYIVFFPRFLSLARPLEPYLAWCPFGAQYAVHGVA